MTNLNFKSFDYGVLVYGSPYYLTLEERDTIFYADLTGWPKHLVENRDKFMFQCFVGCRLSDLNKLTKANVKGDFLEYIPQKSLKPRHRFNGACPAQQQGKGVAGKAKDGRRFLVPLPLPWRL